MEEEKTKAEVEDPPSKDKPSEDGTRKKQKKDHQKQDAVRYHCNYCNRDITNFVRIKCAVCSDFDLCVYCFAVGVEIGPHKKGHDYQVMEALNFPFFRENWGADEELLLLEGIEIYGLGNWRDVSDHVGTKSARACKEHYMTIYIDIPTAPIPDLATVLTTSESLMERNRNGFNVIRLERTGEISNDSDSDAEKKSIGMHSAHYQLPELAGYMTLRGDFETDYENDAELIMMELGFNEDDTPVERDLKLRIIEIYNMKLDERARRKSFILERGIIDAKKEIKKDAKKEFKKRPREDKETRPFARLLTRVEYEEFTQGLIAERDLRKRIKELKNFRKLGIHTVSEGQDYELEKRRRESDIAAGRKPSTSLPPPRKLPPKIEEKKQKRKSGPPLDITTAIGYDLLSEKERELCSSLRLFPQQYLVIKDTLIRESIRQGQLRKATARQLIKIDVNKTGRIFDFFEKIGWINRNLPTSGNTLPPLYYSEPSQPNPNGLSQAFIGFPHPTPLAVSVQQNPPPRPPQAQPPVQPEAQVLVPQPHVAPVE